MASLVGAAMPRGAPPDLATWKLVKWWQGFAGRPLADHVWPSRIERGVLTLGADSSAWASEIAFMRETIVKRLAEELPALKIRSVRTTLGAQRDRPVFVADPSVEPSSRKMRIPAAKGLPRALAVALSRIEDEGLRTVIARAARVSLASMPDDERADQGAGAEGSRSASSPQSSSLSPCPDGSSSDG